MRHGMSEQIVVRSDGGDRVVLDEADMTDGQVLVFVDPIFLGLVRELLEDQRVEMKLREIRDSGIFEVMLRRTPDSRLT